jgi:hypothetical protein
MLHLESELFYRSHEFDDSFTRQSILSREDDKTHLIFNIFAPASELIYGINDTILQKATINVCNIYENIIPSTTTTIEQIATHFGKNTFMSNNSETAIKNICGQIEILIARLTDVCGNKIGNALIHCYRNSKISDVCSLYVAVKFITDHTAEAKTSEYDSRDNYIALVNDRVTSVSATSQDAKKIITYVNDDTDECFQVLYNVLL